MVTRDGYSLQLCCRCAPWRQCRTERCGIKPASPWTKQDVGPKSGSAIFLGTGRAPRTLNSLHYILHCQHPDQGHTYIETPDTYTRNNHNMIQDIPFHSIKLSTNYSLTDQLHETWLNKAIRLLLSAQPCPHIEPPQPQGASPPSPSPSPCRLPPGGT